MNAHTAYGNHGPDPVPGDFSELIRNAMRRLQRSTERSELDRRQVKILEDFGKHGKYVGAFEEVATIARLHCRRDEDAVALADDLWRFIMVGRTIDVCVPSAFRNEQKANEFGNEAQFEYLFSKSRGTLDRVYEAMGGQKVWSEKTMAAVLADRPTLVSVFR